MQNLLQTIGNTPLIKLENLNKNNNSNILIKLEGQNPGGSIKDRVALYMIEKAEKQGLLTKNKTIVEATSGNMGISLAMTGTQKGYKVKIFMSEGMSIERKTMLKVLGAELFLTNKKLGTRGAIAELKKQITKKPNDYWFVNQFNNLDNIKAHYFGIAKELLKQQRKIDYIVMGTGTSGTIMGIAKRFKKYSPNTKIIAVIPPTGYEIQGIQNPYKDFKAGIFDNNLIDEEIEVSVENSYKTARLIAQKEGLFIGMSSGANIYASFQLAKKIKKGNIVTISPDRGEKYLSTNLF